MNGQQEPGGDGSFTGAQVLNLITAANKMFIGNIGVFFRMGMLPAASVVLLALLAQWAAPLDAVPLSGDGSLDGIDAADIWPHLLASLFGYVLLMGFTVACHRFILLGEPQPNRFGIRIGAREFRFLGYAFLVGFLIVLAASLVIMALMTVGQGLGSTFGMAINVVLVSVLFVRLSLVFPAIAVDMPGGLREAWTRTGGHTLNLFGAYLAMYVVFFLLMILPSMAAAGTTMLVGGVGIMVLFNTLAQFMSAAYFAVMLSLVFRALYEKDRPAG